MTTSSCAIRAQDFSSSTRDVSRDRWTDGKLRHVSAALAGTPVAITVDSGTGHTIIGARLGGLNTSLAGGASLEVFSTYDQDGVTHEQQTNYLQFSLGDTIIPLPEPDARMDSAKWRALDSYRSESSEAIRVAQAVAAEEGRNVSWGKWEATPMRNYVSVSYTPQREDGGERWHLPVNLSKLEAATLCRRPVPAEGVVTHRGW